MNASHHHLVTFGLDRFEIMNFALYTLYKLFIFTQSHNKWIAIGEHSHILPYKLRIQEFIREKAIVSRTVMPLYGPTWNFIRSQTVTPTYWFLHNVSVEYVFIKGNSFLSIGLNLNIPLMLHLGHFLRIMLTLSFFFFVLLTSKQYSTRPRWRP